MNRLTVRNFENETCCAVGGCIAYEDCYECPGFQDILAKLAHYEDLEEAGRLVELPCKLGEKVYCIVFENCHDRRCIWFDADGCRKGGISSEFCPQRVVPIEFRLNDINRNIYFTREEAEAALKGAE